MASIADRVSSEEFTDIISSGKEEKISLMNVFGYMVRMS
jgi:hypothetical protein